MSLSTATDAASGDWEYTDRITTLVGAFTAVAVFGWLVSVFLSGIHFFAIPQIPAGAEVSGSLEVITSQYAYVFGIPLATLGAFYYLSTIGMALWWYDTRHPLILKILTPMTATGVVASAYFVYLQLGIIGEICPFCMMSAAASVVLFGLELGMLKTSSLPPLSAMVGDTGTLFSETRIAITGTAVVLGVLTLVAFYGVTLAPVPGT